MALRDFFRRRQSAPAPTAEEYLIGMTQAAETATTGEEPIDASLAMIRPIGKEQISAATTLLTKYMNGKKRTEARIIENEKWYRMRHWDVMVHDINDIKPVSGWLFNALANKHADAMDNFPAPVILPREPGDRAEATALSSIIPAVLDQTDFEKVYSDVQLYKLKVGTGVYAVMWDPQKDGGRGDIVIKKADILNLFWEPGVSDIQDSPNLFHVYLCENEELESEYPELRGKLSGKTLQILDYAHDDAIDSSTKTPVIEWYYKRRINGRTVLHYCKYVNDIVLYATENGSEAQRTRGLYDHGRYPFEFDTLYTVEGSPVGFGFVDVAKNDQEYIDRIEQAVLENTLQGATPRFFERIEGSINEEEFTNLKKKVVHVSGNLGEDSIRVIDTAPLQSIYVDVLNMKIEELKETTGNRDVSSGGTTSGVTAASAIAAMQEAGAKTTRDNNRSSYRTYRQIIIDVIELIRQFYDIPRQFRILGKNGETAFVEYRNTGLAPVPVKNADGDLAGYRTPVFDVDTKAEKSSPYTRIAQNEFALQLYGQGFFNPQMTDQALATVDMMDFPGKEEVLAKIAQNGTMYQKLQACQGMLMRFAQIIDAMQGTDENTTQVAAMFGTAAPAMPSGDESAGGEGIGGESTGGESSTTAKARERAARATEV